MFTTHIANEQHMNNEQSVIRELRTYLDHHQVISVHLGHLVHALEVLINLLWTKRSDRAFAKRVPGVYQTRNPLSLCLWLSM